MEIVGVFGGHGIPPQLTLRSGKSGHFGALNAGGHQPRSAVVLPPRSAVGV